MGWKDQVNSFLNEKGIGDSIHSQGNQNMRNVYPAIVVSTEDPMEMNRIKARIVSLDNNGNITGGRDREKEDNQVPFCVPLMPNHIHVRPLENEMVMVILENPSDDSAPRYWIGPMNTSKLKLKFQSYQESDSIFRYTNFNPNSTVNNQPGTALAIPAQSDIALNGRDDADIILRSREVFISAGKFITNTFNPNLEAPCNIQLKQFDSEAGSANPSFSQLNLQSNNVNLYSPFGKFRKASDSEDLEPSNTDLRFLGELANQLHPLPFGDNLIKLLDLMIRITLTHIHTPQKELVETPDSQELSAFTLEGRLQELISKHMRIN